MRSEISVKMIGYNIGANHCLSSQYLRDARSPVNKTLVFSRVNRRHRGVYSLHLKQGQWTFSSGVELSAHNRLVPGSKPGGSTIWM